jgi:serine/threonine protein phosphatase PrpC
MRVIADCFGLTDRGRVRDSNEDQFLVAELSKSLLVEQTSLDAADQTRLFGGPPGRLFLVADGMGGERGGRRASRLVVETLTEWVLETMHWFFRLQDGSEVDLVEELKGALAECQQVVETAAAADPDRGRMGTTLTLAYLLWPRLYVIHVGDSRCYLFRGGQLDRITRDQTVAQRLVDEGMLPAEEVETSRWTHVLYSCISGRPHSLQADVYKSTLEPGDTLLVCTDGLTKHVPDTSLVEQLGRVGGEGAEAIARRLVAAANEAGGKDNITAVVAHFRPPGDERGK